MKLNVVRLPLLRLKAYQLIGAMLLYPDEAVIDAASEAARDLRRGSRWVAELAFYQPWSRFLRCVEALTPAHLPELQERYAAHFSAGTSQEPAVPLYESVYTDPQAEAAGLLLAELEREYATAGLLVTSSSGETADHVSVELEFVSILSAQEVDASEAGDLAGVLKAVNSQKTFIERHPCRWFPSLARTVTDADGPGLYARATQAARAMVAHDASFLAALAEGLKPAVEARQT